MKLTAIVALLKEGKKPMVMLTGSPWDDAFGVKGMLARITKFKDRSERDDTVVLTFDYNKHINHNLALQEHNWYIWKDGKDTGKLGTIFEAGSMKEDNVVEDIYFDADGDVPAELADDNRILAEYSASGSKLSYVGWLEAKLEELVPECMKTWSDKI